MVPLSDRPSERGYRTRSDTQTGVIQTVKHRTRSVDISSVAIRRRTGLRSTAHTVAGVALVTIGFGATLATFLGFFGDTWWAFDVLANFRLQFAIVLFGVAALYGLVMSRGAAFVFLVVALVNVALIVPLYVGSPVEATGVDEITLVSFNVRTSSAARDQVMRWIEGTDADVVFILESSAEWERSSAAAAFEYSIQSELPDDRRFSITVLAKDDVNTELLRLGTGRDPVIRVEVSLENRPLVIYAVHPRPATSEAGAEMHNSLLEQVAELVDDEVDPVIVIGDLNATPWSSAFRALESDAGLVNSLDGFGLQPTWPGNLPFGLTIPIDHMLHTSELTTVDRSVGPSLGSDHRPLVVTVGRAAS